ncbi:MAG: hypothetical protein DCO96_00445 [Fluviicola sp. XM-24bin1]|nr:MAG: hypothetical protein DCO96_00445 [Fluviicola sp. XM-24bin1]
MIKSLFISKHSSEVLELQQFADANEIQLEAKSFLKFSPVDFTLPSSFDVIFFGSPRALIFYQSRYSIPQNVQIASVGGKTTTLLRSMGYNVAFNGENHGSISEVAKSFQIWLQDRKALFPVSTKSLGTISKGLPYDQAIHVECYKTEIVPLKLDTEFDVYVFTSPSNVEGYFGENAIPESSAVIAWGESTQKKLDSFDIVPITLDEPSLQHLQEHLSKM